MAKERQRRAVPVVFISSTYEDLNQHRAQARDAAIQAGFYPVMQEYFVSGPHDPLPVCLGRVEEADVVVVIAAHRYGWAPEDQPGDEAKSITWLECAHAADEGKDLLVFTVDSESGLTAEAYEVHRITEAVSHGGLNAKLTGEVARNVVKLGEFKKWLETGRTRRTFNNPERLRAEVGAALGAWLKDHPDFAAVARPLDTSDPRLP